MHQSFARHNGILALIRVVLMFVECKYECVYIFENCMFDKYFGQIYTLKCRESNKGELHEC